VLNELINGTIAPNEPDIFRELYEASLNGYGGSRPDEYYVLKDFESYKDAQELGDKAYKDEKRWVGMSIMNVANSGKFSSDRTIREYAGEIWHLKQVPIHI
jgi:starch phosphorylase